MHAPQKIAVAGATGRVGAHIVDVLTERGHEVVPMARGVGVDVISGDGLADAVAGATCIVDAATGPSPDQRAATEFFTAATRNLHAAGAAGGAERMIVLSIIGTDRFTAGYNAAKAAHERAALAGPVPVQILRAAQFHEFVPQLVAWGTQGDRAYVQQMRTSSSGPGPWPRWSPTWSRAPLPTARPSPRSPVPARRAWSRRRGCSPPGAASGSPSRA